MLAGMGYTVGVGKVLVSPALLSYVGTGALLYATTDEPQYRSQADQFSAMSRVISEKGLLGAAIDGAVATGQGIQSSIERGDAYGAGVGAGEVATSVVLTAGGALNSIPNVTVAGPSMAQATIGGGARAMAQTAIASGGPAPIAALGPVFMGSGERHTAEWELRDSAGRIRTRGTSVSGSDVPPGRRLSWAEQLATHTERKIIESVRSLAAKGDILSIRGRLSPMPFT